MLVLSGCQHRSLSPAKTRTCKLGKGELLVCWPFEVLMRFAQKLCLHWCFPASPALAPHQPLVSWPEASGSPCRGQEGSLQIGGGTCFCNRGSQLIFLAGRVMLQVPGGHDAAASSRGVVMSRLGHALLVCRAPNPAMQSVHPLTCRNTCNPSASCCFSRSCCQPRLGAPAACPAPS